VSIETAEIRAHRVDNQQLCVGVLTQSAVKLEWAEL
jgi:hypothetical protein